MDSARVVLHLDMDAFFAAVEVLDRPELRGKPVIVGGSPEGHGVVSTASYEARRFGVGSAMPASIAVRRCPQGVFLPPRPARYAEISRVVMAVLADYSPAVERLSIDEAFVDLTGSERLLGAPGDVAREIKRRVADETGGLMSSVGVAPNKFVAKVASDLRKPDGLVIVGANECREFLAPLSIERIWGVGPKTAERLHAAGYHRVRDLQRASEGALGASFGRDFGRHVFRLANGLDDRPVEPHSEPRSVSSETTFATFIPPGDTDAIERELLRLSEEVARRLRRDGLRGYTVTVKVRDERFVTKTRSETGKAPVELTDELYGIACRLFRDRVTHGHWKIRLLGVAVTQLQSNGPRQLDLFEDESDQRVRGVEDAVDAIRSRLGRDAIQRARLVPPSSD